MELKKDELREMYRRMLLIRRFDEAVSEMFDKGDIPGAVHLSIGQEAEVVGACMAVREDDYMLGNHRSHGHPIGKGAKVDALMAELLGKATGINQGKGGSMHLADFSVGSLGESSIVGSGLPVAVGAALGAKMQNQDRVTLCFFGDGASNQGYFHEALNMAALWSLPVIFLCENNGYGVTTPVNRSAAMQDIASRAAGYDMPAEIVDGQDCLVVYQATCRAAERARSGQGPSLVEAKTYRYHHHSEGPLYEPIHYRSDSELQQWRQRDPLDLFQAYLTDQEGFTGEELEAVNTAVEAEVTQARQFAYDSPYPEPEAAYIGLYRNPPVQGGRGHA